MQMISGTVKNAVQLQMLDNKWQQKKEAGKLSKEERNARDSWTQEDYLMQDIREQAEQNRKTLHDTKIDSKIMAGGTLTPDEEKYLEQNNPEALKKYKEIKAEKKAYEDKLRRCRTKDEVERVKLNTMSEYAASLKKVINNPVIPKSEKLAKAQEMLAKTNNIQDVHISFVNSPEYKQLPTEGEEAVERAEERQAEYDSMTGDADGGLENVDNSENIEYAEDVDAAQNEDGIADIKDNLHTDKNAGLSQTDSSVRLENDIQNEHEDIRTNKKTYLRHSAAGVSKTVKYTNIIIDDIKDTCAKLIGQSINYTA